MEDTSNIEVEQIVEYNGEDAEIYETSNIIMGMDTQQQHDSTSEEDVDVVPEEVISSQEEDKPRVYPDLNQLLPPILRVERNITQTTVHAKAVTELTYTEFPGHVVNYGNAVCNMGGMGKISNTFATKSPKLEIKFRPGDPYCNPVYADGSKTCGFLLRIRRRKVKKPAKDEIKKTEAEVIKSIIVDTFNLDPIRLAPDDDSKLLDLCPGIYGSSTIDGVLDANELSASILNRFEALERHHLKQDGKVKFIENINVYDGTIPQTKSIQLPTRDPDRLKLLREMEKEEAKNSDLQISILGIAERSYTCRRGQICDVQYLPTKLSKGKQVSLLNKILPIFNDPEKGVQFVSDTLDTENTKIPYFLPPPYVYRIDKPVISYSGGTDEAQNLLKGDGGEAETIIELENLCKSESVDEFIIVPIRSKRVIFSHIADFRATDEFFFANPDGSYVPKEPMPGAMDDIHRRNCDVGGLIQTLRTLFEKRPAWSKQALEYETKKPHSTLKFILPVIAYFALNGPWRSLWVKIGFDPRKFKTSFEYQTLDYRIPFVYRNFTMVASFLDESNCRYKRNMIPPKAQMFYQLCDVQIKEVEQLKNILRSRLGLDDQNILRSRLGLSDPSTANNSSANVVFSPKYGFMDEETLEYCRYNISRYVEIILKEQGKIAALTLPEIELLPGGVVPKEKLKAGVGRNPNNSFSPVRSRYRPPKPDLKANSFISRARARRNSASSSINDLEIDRDEFDLSQEDVESDGDVEFDDDDDFEQQADGTYWSIVNPDQDVEGGNDDDDDDEDEDNN